MIFIMPIPPTMNEMKATPAMNKVSKNLHHFPECSDLREGVIFGDQTYPFSLFISFCYLILWESFPVIVENPLFSFLPTSFDLYQSRFKISYALQFLQHYYDKK